MRGGAPILAALLLGAASPLVAAGDPDPRTCELRNEAEFFQRRSDLPQDMQAALGKPGPMAEAGERYNATDAIDTSLPPVPFDRFVLSGKSGDRWFVWYESGGMSRQDRVVGWMPLHKDDGTTGPFLVADFMGTPCKAIDAFLDNVFSNLYEKRVGRPN